MRMLAHLDNEWAGIEEYGDFRMLPEGTRNYTITRAEARQNDNLGRPEVVVHVTHPDGGGQFEISLAPYDPSDPESVDKFKRQLKTNMARLGYEGPPSQFGGFLPRIAGTVVELEVEHKASEKVNPKTGEPYVNQRAYLRALVRKPGEAAQAEEATFGQEPAGSVPPAASVPPPPPPPATHLDAPAPAQQVVTPQQVQQQAAESFGAVPAGQQPVDDIPF